MPTVSALVLTNTLVVFTLAVITVSSTHFSATSNEPGKGLDYLSQYEMRMRA